MVMSHEVGGREKRKDFLHLPALFFLVPAPDVMTLVSKNSMPCLNVSTTACIYKSTDKVVCCPWLSMGRELVNRPNLGTEIQRRGHYAQSRDLTAGWVDFNDITLLPILLIHLAFCLQG